LKRLISAIKQTFNNNQSLPFAVYTSVKEQHILNVPIVKPLLIVVLSGSKHLGSSSDLICQAGDFVVLSDNSSLTMRNIPEDEEYLALLIEFEHDELNDFRSAYSKLPIFENNKHHCYGKTTQVLAECLTQFVECVAWAPASVLTNRKKEILALLLSIGHTDILSLSGHTKVSHQVHDMYNNTPEFDLPLDVICERVAMSESTLRRKLKTEGTSLQQIKDQARLGLGLHLLQTTQHSIGLIAEKCGYQSHTKFTARFKSRFGLTPSELRQTKR
jgi:AraC-like DNA-binding protein